MIVLDIKYINPVLPTDHWLLESTQAEIIKSIYNSWKMQLVTQVANILTR